MHICTCVTGFIKAISNRREILIQDSDACMLDLHYRSRPEEDQSYIDT